MSTETADVAEGWPDEHMAEAAWGLIANAYHGNWDTEAPGDWRQAAERWREAYHRSIASPEPSEPPPGVYQDAAGHIWRRSRTSSCQEWQQMDARTWHTWEGVWKYAEFPLVPLFPVDELIPDPTDDQAVAQMAAEAGFSMNEQVERNFRRALRVLRARAEARQTEGGSDGT